TSMSASSDQRVSRNLPEHPQPLPTPKSQVYRSKYLNNIVEQDHRGVKRRTRPMMGFKSFGSAGANLDGIETAHMIRKGQLGNGCPFAIYASFAA
ncbi:DDE-type integrase/transposase/recombinase, partial [uncultured Roseobacter sp.]|uniref:DDE-type integrase/transposase/recombinase n=1 Tax=uncultured Roseobacter sp. TaxID=114847 RepID=UPI002606A4F2